MRLDFARARMNAYLAAHGGRMTISRKSGATWETVASDVPVIAESRQRQGAIEPMGASPDMAQVTQLSVPFGTDLQAGDRAALTLPNGTAPEPLTISAVEHNSLDVMTQATAMVEQLAVETYPVTITRYDEETGQYLGVLTAEAQVVIENVGIVETRESGTTGARRAGTLIFTPVPAVPLGVGDWIEGIPWARAATITLIRPVVGTRLEVEFRFDSGGAA